MFTTPSLNFVVTFQERFVFVPRGGIYILKNELVVNKLKNLILSLMSLEAELRGKEKELLTDAILNIRKCVELLK